MKTAVIGLGAVGTVFATFLKETGNTVFGITKQKYINSFKNNTVSVEGIWGKHSAKLDGVYSSVNELPSNIDLFIVAVKSYDTKAVIKQIKSVLKEDSFVLLAQNGYGNYETAKQIIPAKNLLLARVIFGSKITRPATAEITVNADDVVIGQPENLADEEKVVKVVETIKNSGIPARYDPNVYQILWDKILYNCALNPLGAILECSYGDLAENKETRELMNQIIKEIFEVARLNNIKLRWKTAEEYIEHFYKNLIPPTKKHYPSMYWDIKAGKKTEIDALNGAVVELAKDTGAQVPTNENITKLLKFKEQRNLKES